MPGQIHDSNRYLLLGLLAGVGAVAFDLDPVGDCAERIAAALAQAVAGADAVITSGGVSAGDADLTCDAIARMGRLAFHRVDTRPGRPSAFGRVGDAWVFALSGKPAGLMAAFRGYVADGLRWLGGEAPAPRPRFVVPAAEPIAAPRGPATFRQGTLFADAGRWLVRPAWADGGRVASMCAANCYIVLPAGSRGAAAGDPVLVQPFGVMR